MDLDNKTFDILNVTTDVISDLIIESFRQACTYVLICENGRKEKYKRLIMESITNKCNSITIKKVDGSSREYTLDNFKPVYERDNVVFFKLEDGTIVPRDEIVKSSHSVESLINEFSAIDTKYGVLILENICSSFNRLQLLLDGSLYSRKVNNIQIPTNLCILTVIEEDEWKKYGKIISLAAKSSFSLYYIK